jgi:hypothetical protein
MLTPPLRLVPIQQRVDLRRAFAERTDVAGQLLDLTLGGQCVAMCGQRGPEVRVAGNCGMPDAVDRGEHVPDRHGVQAAPLARGEYARVDLEIEMPVRVSRDLLMRSCMPQLPDDLFTEAS